MRLAKRSWRLYGVAVAGMFFVWIVILFTHMAFRRALGPERIARLPMRLHWYPYASIARNRGAPGNHSEHVFRRWIAIYGPDVHSVPGGDLDCLLDCAAKGRLAAGCWHAHADRAREINLDIGGPNFGGIMSMAGTPHEIQYVLGYEF